MRFQGKVAVVVGGAGGIGYGISKSLAEEGATVIIWDNKSEVAEKAAHELATKNKKAVAMTVNAMENDQVKQGVGKVISEHGKIDFMVCTVGGGVFRPTVNYDISFFQSQMDFNLLTVVNCFISVLPHMVEKQFGRMLCFTSALGGQPGLLAYQCGKAAVKSLIQTISAEHTKDHITVNAIMPAAVDTPLLRSAYNQAPNGEEYFNAMVAALPLGINTVENIAAEAMFILSDDAKRLTGQVFTNI